MKRKRREISKREKYIREKTKKEEDRRREGEGGRRRRGGRRKEARRRKEEGGEREKEEGDPGLWQHGDEVICARSTHRGRLLWGSTDAPDCV